MAQAIPSQQFTRTQEQTQSVSSQKLYLQNAVDFFTNNKKVIVKVLVFLVAAFFIKATFFKPAIISVVGTGRLTAKPAQVEMLVTKVDSNPDPVLAIIAGEESINQIIARAKELAGEDVEVQKSFYQVTPTVVTGDVLYQVVNVFKITANDPTKTSDLIKGFYSSGATTVSGVNFIPVEREKVTQEARKAAIKDARQKAKDIARASRKMVGRIVSIGDDFTTGNSTISTNGGGAVAGQEVSAEVNYNNGVPEEIDISKSMTVTYEIW